MKLDLYLDFLFSAFVFVKSEKYVRLRQCREAEWQKLTFGILDAGGDDEEWCLMTSWKGGFWLEGLIADGQASTFQFKYLQNPSLQNDSKERECKFDCVQVAESVVSCDWLKRSQETAGSCSDRACAETDCCPIGWILRILSSNLQCKGADMTNECSTACCLSCSKIVRSHKEVEWLTSFSSDGVGHNFTMNLSHWATLQPAVSGGECKTKLYNDGDYSEIKEMSHFTCLQLCVQWFTFNFLNCCFSIQLFVFFIIWYDCLNGSKEERSQIHMSTCYN